MLEHLRELKNNVREESDSSDCGLGERLLKAWCDELAVMCHKYDVAEHDFCFDAAWQYAELILVDLNYYMTGDEKTVPP